MKKSVYECSTSLYRHKKEIPLIWLDLQENEEFSLKATLLDHQTE